MFLLIRVSLASGSLSPPIFLPSISTYLHWTCLPWLMTPAMANKSTRSKKTAAAAAASAMDTNAIVANNGMSFNSFNIFHIHMPLLQMVLQPTAMLLLLLLLQTLPQALVLIYSMTLAKVWRLNSRCQTISDHRTFISFTDNGQTQGNSIYLLIITQQTLTLRRWTWFHSISQNHA